MPGNTALRTPCIHTVRLTDRMEDCFQAESLVHESATFHTTSLLESMSRDFEVQGLKLVPAPYAWLSWNWTWFGTWLQYGTAFHPYSFDVISNHNEIITFTISFDHFRLCNYTAASFVPRQASSDWNILFLHQWRKVERSRHFQHEIQLGEKSRKNRHFPWPFRRLQHYIHGHMENGKI